MTILGIFPCEVKDNIFMQDEKQTLENLETWKNSNFLFGWRGPLVMIFGGVGAGGPDLGGGSGSRSCNGRESDGTGSWGQECQMAGEGGDCRGQEGQMAVARDSGAGGSDGRGGGQEADGREPDGARQWGKEGQMAMKEGMAGCMMARWQLLGVVGLHGAGVQDGGQAGARSGGKG